jgi:hypothetical protein
VSNRIGEQARRHALFESFNPWLSRSLPALRRKPGEKWMPEFFQRRVFHCPNPWVLMRRLPNDKDGV